jgi:hypothetical protein
VHEVKLIVDLIFEGGIERMHYSISDTAEYGSIAVGPRVVDAHVKENMKGVLTAIQDGSFAREWIAEMDKGSPSLTEAREKLGATGSSGPVSGRGGARLGWRGAWRRLTSRRLAGTAPSAGGQPPSRTSWRATSARDRPPAAVVKASSEIRARS